jgi:hypothetical protein
MNPDNDNEMVSTLPNDQVENKPHPVNQITRVSKYLAMVLFVLLPFIGAYVGYQLAPEKVVEVPINTNVETPPINNNTTVENNLNGKFKVVTERFEPLANIVWKDASVISDTRAVTFSYPESLPIDFAVMENPTYVFSGDPGIVGYILPLLPESKIKAVTIDENFEYIYFISHVEDVYVSYVASLESKQVFEVARYKQGAVDSNIQSNDFYTLLPYFLQSSPYLVFNTYDERRTKKVGNIVDVSLKNSIITMQCESDSFRIPNVSSDFKYITWVCPEVGLMITDMVKATIIVPSSSTMEPVNPRWKERNIIFSNSAESNDMLQAPVYLVSLDGSNLNKTTETDYMGF